MAALDFNEALRQASNKLKVPDHFVWKKEQLDCLKAIYHGEDVMAVLPTGFGKSIIFQTTPFLLAARDRVAKCPIVIVITPLNAIMMDQCRQLNDKGIKACFIDFICEKGYTCGDSDEETTTEGEAVQGNLYTTVSLEDVQRGEYNIIYSHPESLMCAKGRRMLRAIRKDLCALAIDEAHIILEW
jgi:ATP-dependent DNA helicase RecQ